MDDSHHMYSIFCRSSNDLVDFDSPKATPTKIGCITSICSANQVLFTSKNPIEVVWKKCEYGNISDFVNHLDCN